MKDADQFADLHIEATQKHGSLILTKVEVPKTHSEILYEIIKRCRGLLVRSAYHVY